MSVIFSPHATVQEVDHHQIMARIKARGVAYVVVGTDL
jgi:hypothetical protein